jgi:probable HAF family extracellular repeat protein
LRLGWIGAWEGLPQLTARRFGLDMEEGAMGKIGVALLAVIVLMLVPVAGAQSYTITDIGEIGRSDSEPRGAVNDHGAIAGSFINGNDLEQAFLWTDKTGVRDLGFLPGFDQSATTGINNAGHVVGYSSSSTTGLAHAFLWTQAGGMQDLGVLPGGNASYAYGVNESDQVVGYSYIDTLGESSHAFLWTQSGGMQDIGTLGGLSSGAAAISESGIVVGSSYLSGNVGPSHAFAWAKAGGMEDLGVLGEGTYSGASAINASGEIVGYSAFTATGSEIRPIYWTQATGMRPLDNVDSNAISVNDSGAVVGSASGRGRLSTSFLWTQANQYQDLNTLIPPNSGWNIQIAWGINRTGQIMATGTFADRTHAALLTPANQE